MGDQARPVADEDDLANLRDALNDAERPKDSRIEVGEEFAWGLLNLIEDLRAGLVVIRNITTQLETEPVETKGAAFGRIQEVVVAALRGAE